MKTNKLKKFFSNFNPNNPTTKQLNFLVLIRIIRRNLKASGFKTIHRNKGKFRENRELKVIEPRLCRCYIIFDEKHQYFKVRPAPTYKALEKTIAKVEFKANTWNEFLDKMVRYDIFDSTSIDNMFNK